MQKIWCLQDFQPQSWKSKLFWYKAKHIMLGILLRLYILYTLQKYVCGVVGGGGGG